MNLPQTYAGHRILEAMRSAPRYADAVYRLMRSALTPGSARVLDFGAGDGMFAERMLRDGIKVGCVEPDPDNQHALAALGLPAVADIAALEEGRYDFVYTVNDLEHL